MNDLGNLLAVFLTAVGGVVATVMAAGSRARYDRGLWALVDDNRTRLDHYEQLHRECEARATALEVRIAACEEDRQAQKGHIDAGAQDRAELRGRVEILTKTITGGSRP